MFLKLKMSDIKAYYGKKVQIVDDEGKVWKGKVVLYFDSDENDSGLESIAIRTDGILVEFGSNEIIMIKEIA